LSCLFLLFFHFVGLDVDGQIVDGVVVEKQVARIAFEKEVRKGIDPGFVELVAGNVFRTRVYPIRPRQTRIVRVIYQDQAKPISINNSLIFHIPIQFSQRLESFDLVLRCFSQTGTNSKPTFVETSPIANHDYPSFLTNGTGNYVAEWHLTNVEPPMVNKPFIEYLLPEVLKPTMNAVELDPIIGAYFAVSLALPSTVQLDSTPSRSICILWDASLSRADAFANRTLELNALKAILDNWLMKFDLIRLTIVVFRNDMEEPKYLLYRSNSWSELKKVFDEIIYDGATNLTQLANLQLSHVITHYFLFSDCMSNIGHQNLKDDSFAKLSAPFWIFNGNATHQPVDHGLIRYLTERSYGGGYVDRSRLEQSLNELVTMIDRVQMKYIGLQTSNAHACCVYPSHGMSLSSNRDRFLLVGQLSAPLPTSIQGELEFAFNNQTCRAPFSCDISISPPATHFGLIRRQWAQQKLQELSAFKDKNRREIIALGMEYSLVTDFTSLMVLETLQQHLQYRICPAKTRTKLYEDYMTHQKAEENKKPNKAASLISNWTQYCNWYDRVITDIDRHRAFLPPTYQPIPVTHSSGPFGMFHFPTVPTSTTTPFFGSSVLQPQTTANSFSFGAAPSAPVSTSYMPLLSSPSASTTFDAKQEIPTTFVLYDYNHQASSVSRLQSAATVESAYTMYLSERSSYRQSPSFYFDIASFFFAPRFTSSVLDMFNQQSNASTINATDPKSIVYAIRILTNILELQLEAPQLLRTVVYKLMEISRWDLAIDLCRKICLLRPDEPQSLHDLALVSMELGEDQQAFDCLKKIINDVWDARLAGIEPIALVDFNRLLVKMMNKEPNIPAIDRQFIRYLPVDIRIVLEWDEPDTFLTLSVTEPTGQVCNIQRAQTDIGGSIMNFTSPFLSAHQPQQYVLKTTIPGSYIIHVTLNRHTGQAGNGATTAMLYMYKHYGSDNEEKHIRAIRLTELGQKVEIGRIEFGDLTVAKLQEELRIVRDRNRHLRDQLNGIKNINKSLIQHGNTTCDACGSTPIIGDRYKCMFCPNLDFCQECQMFSTTLNQYHDIQHPLICIHDSSLYTKSIHVINHSDIIHPQTKCSSCSTSPIVGIRYTCSKCGIDLCERCEFIGVHDPTHQRIKLMYPQLTLFP
jgi:hypothetical protein